jgi:peptidyl-tRNA hydrolase, PTH1 family
LDEAYIIVGLGNPGRKYEGTRHNAGFGVIDILSQKHVIRVAKLKHRAYMGEGTICGVRVLLVKPCTFMNLSGESVRDIVKWHKTGAKTEYKRLDRLILIYDDVDLPQGTVRVRAKGSAGTHNGMRSVIYNLGTDEFPRVRIGIGTPPKEWELADYVLGKFEKDKYQVMSEAFQMAAQAVEKILSDSVEAAMNEYNKSVKLSGSEICET